MKQLVAGRVVVNITLVAGATLVAVASMPLVTGAGLDPVQV